MYQRPPPELQSRIIDFWKRNNALNPGTDPQQRVREVVLVAFNQGGDVAGVNTVYTGRLRADGPLLFFYRQFIQPADRVFGLMRFMTMTAWEALRDDSMQDKPVAVVIISENKKLMRPGMVALLKSRDWQLIGKTSQQQDVWYKAF